MAAEKVRENQVNAVFCGEMEESMVVVVVVLWENGRVSAKRVMTC